MLNLFYIIGSFHLVFLSLYGTSVLLLETWFLLIFIILEIILV